MEWFQLLSTFVSSLNFWAVFFLVSLLFGYVGIFIIDYRDELANTSLYPRATLKGRKSRKHKQIIVTKEGDGPDKKAILKSIFEVNKERWRDSKSFFILMLLITGFFGSIMFLVSLLPRKILDAKF